MNHSISAHMLQEMKQYYRERAQEYDEWFYRQGRYVLEPEMNTRWFTEADEVFAMLASLHLTGDVLELAPGTGIWTERLVRTAATITAVDASPEMIEINKAKVASNRVSYIVADIFSWQPERVYDAVSFSFWISHVPLERLDDFLRSVRDMLRPGGKVFFVDGRKEITSTTGDQQLPAQESQISTRVLNNGRTFDIVKNFYDPTDLAARCARVGFDITVRETATYFLYGYGTRT